MNHSLFVSNIHQQHSTRLIKLADSKVEWEGQPEEKQLDEFATEGAGNKKTKKLDEFVSEGGVQNYLK